MKTAIVTGSDAGMFDLLLDLVRSIRSLAGPERDLDVCALDAGLTVEQRATLAPMVTRIAVAEWDVEFNHAGAPSWFKVMVARPHLPRYFPEYELLLWIDADAWVCNADGVRLLLRAGEAYGLAIVPELERSYRHCFHVVPGRGRNLEQTYLYSFGEDAARRFAHLPVLNDGVFAMRRDSPFWTVWSEILGPALRRAPRTMTEQCALNLGVYTNRITAHLLPAWCNWMCVASPPVLDRAAGTLHAPFLPHERISICHLADLKRATVQVRCFDGPARRTPLTYRAIRGGPPRRANTIAAEADT